MKITSDSVDKLDLLIQTALNAGLKKLVIDGTKIRGIDEKQSIVIFTPVTSNNVPDFGGKQIGFTQIQSLAARLNLVKSQGSVDVTATEATNKTDISLLDLSSGKVKTQFRCASLETIKGIPKNVADVLVWEIKVDGKALPLISQAVTAMAAESITIASKDGSTVTVELVDTSKDIFSIELSEPATWIGTSKSPGSFCYKYPSKTFVSLLKDAIKCSDPVVLQLGEGGIASFNINGFNFFLLPSA